MNTTETIIWIPIEDGPPDEEGLYLVNRYDGQYSIVTMENWEGVPHEGPGPMKYFRSGMATRVSEGKETALPLKKGQ